MKLPIALGVALAGAAFSLAVTATAQTATPAPAPAPTPAPRAEREHHVRMHAPMMGFHANLENVDANRDGWLSRAEAQAQADRMFDQLDTNHDNKLDQADHQAGGEGVHTFRLSREGGDHDVVIERGGPGARTIIINRDGDSDEDVEVHADGDSHVERHVTIIRNGQVESDEGGSDGDRPRAPRPPRAPHPPMMMMLFANSDEADRNNDGALSKEEFRAQHMRFFEASDANNDGKIRFPRIELPAPPEPPTPPTPPAPPAPRR